MSRDLFRPLKEDEIECRISAINSKGISLILYKDARVDQRILDETFGAFSWKRSHQSIDGYLYCTVEIKDSKTGEWIGKQDVGAKSNTEKEKTQASDSFKRACFNWGIGRELYSAPFIWIPAAKACIQNKNDKLYCNDKFHVYSIECNENKEICSLVIVNGNGEIVYSFKSINSTITKSQIVLLYNELQRTGVSVDVLKNRYNISDIELINSETYSKIMKALSKTKSINIA